jgi:hypothetical protein
MVHERKAIAMTCVPTGFKDWRKKTLFMPNDEKIVCFFFKPDFADMVSPYDENHNLFRLNAQNKVIWQVHRDDSNYPSDWWDTLDRIAREEGRDAARHPLWYITLEYPDGSTNTSPKTGDPPDEAIWTPDCTILVKGIDLPVKYILDPETGIAKNLPRGRPQRPW